MTFGNISNEKFSITNWKDTHTLDQQKRELVTAEVRIGTKTYTLTIAVGKELIEADNAEHKDAVSVAQHIFDAKIQAQLESFANSSGIELEINPEDVKDPVKVFEKDKNGNIVRVDKKEIENNQGGSNVNNYKQTAMKIGAAINLKLVYMGEKDHLGGVKKHKKEAEEEEDRSFDVNKPQKIATIQNHSPDFKDESNDLSGKTMRLNKRDKD